MFRGISEVSLDDKGRVAIPVRIRASLIENYHGQLVATIDPQYPCLLIYPAPLWDSLQDKINALPGIFQPSVRRLQRLLVGYATDLIVDSNGRVLLPGPLRDYANLTKQVVLLGQGDKLELWDSLSWQKQRESYLQTADISDELPEALRKLSL